MHDMFMRRCLELAEKGRGKTGINPMVGSVLVRDGTIIAEGFHEAFGKVHAERQLFEKSDQKISSKDVLYVNLEPCCHTEKKTPPCTQMIVEQGIKTVVYGMRDPNPAVSGKGIELLRSKGVEVIGPMLPAESMRLNRGFISLMAKGRPWITLKEARTVDGRIANADGSMMKITSNEQDAWSHAFLRARHDAILVGVGTIVKDDSRLTVRLPLTPACRQAGPTPSPKGRGEHCLQRIILDPALHIPLTAKVVQAPLVARTIIIVAPGYDQEKSKELESRGVTVTEISVHDGIFDWLQLWKALTTPNEDFYGISSILVEGGAKTWAAFRKAGMVDEEVLLLG